MHRKLRSIAAALALMIALSATGASASTSILEDGPQFTMPTPRARISTPFGERGPHWRVGYHPGIDFAVRVGTPIYAIADGVVIEAEESGWNKGYGSYVKIDHGNGLHSLYAHLSRVRIEVGEKVALGETIALSGNTGYSTGPHLHLEVRVDGQHTDPAPYLGI